MATLAKHLILCSSTTTSSSASPSPSNRRRPPSSPEGADMRANVPQSATRRLAVAASTAMVATAALSAWRPAAPPPALAAEAAVVPTPAPLGTVPRWGTRLYVRERFFEPGLTSEEAAARIRQTAEGMRTLRPMLETMSWKYVLFYVRLKSKYLDLDLTTAMAGVPELRRPDYVRVANELVMCYKTSDSGQTRAAALGVVDPPMLRSTLETRQTQSSEMSTTLDLKARTND